MNLLEMLHATDALHSISQALIIPVVVILLFFLVYAVYSLGSLVVEALTERKHYQVVLPQLISKLDEASYAELDQVIAGSGLLDTQREALLELTKRMYLPEDALTEVARGLLAAESDRYQKALSWTETGAKISPMVGLMGTLIPLGPGIVALSTGNLETLSSSLLMAFDTTVAGLAVAVVCYLITKLRRRWYSGYLVSVEGAMNTLLEKSRILHEEGFDFAAAETDGGASAGTRAAAAVPVSAAPATAAPAPAAGASTSVTATRPATTAERLRAMAEGTSHE